MAKKTKLSMGNAAFKNINYKFDGNFKKGSTPTLLDSSQAQIVKAFIENIVFHSKFQIVTGETPQTRFHIDFTHDNMVVFDLMIPTALKFDETPTLGGNLILNGHEIHSNVPGFKFLQYAKEGFQIHPQNAPSPTESNFESVLRLFGWDGTPGTPYNVGFRAPDTASLAGSGSLDADNGLVWVLPYEDGTANQVLATDGSGTLSFIDGSGFTFDFSDGANSFSVDSGDTITFSSSDGSVSIDCSTADTIDLTASGGGGGGAFPITGNQNEIVTIDADGDPIVSTDIKSNGGSGNLADKYFTFVDLKNSVDYYLGRKTDSHAFCEGLGVTTSESNGPVAEFYESAATIGNYRTVSINHSQHELDGSDQGGYNKNNVLDVHGSITIRPASIDPQSQSGIYGQIINEQSGNAGAIYMPKNTYNVNGRTQAIVWNVDADGNNDEVEWHQVIKSGGEISTISANYSSGLHINAQSGSSVSLQDGTLLTFTGGTDISTTVSSGFDSVNNPTCTVNIAYTGSGGGGGSGTVTSVGLTSSDGSVSITGGPITTSGTIDLSVSGGGGGGGVSSVDITSTNGTIDTSGGPITSSGTLDVDLPYQGTSGTYTSADITVDDYGIITSVSSGGGGGGGTLFDFQDPNYNNFSVSSGDTVEFVSNDSSIDIDCSTSGQIDLTVASGGGGSGLDSFEVFDDMGNSWTLDSSADDFNFSSSDGFIEFDCYDANYVDAYSGSSDKRLKENIEPLKGSAEKVAALRAVEFDWTDEREIKFAKKRTGTARDFGFIAQEVEKVVPEVVGERRNGMKTINYAKVVPLLLDVIQDLTQRIERLESKSA